MPKTEIDYSNTIIYKITCKDKNITDVYVGHTTNFVQRKHAHKQSCLNKTAANHNCKLYEVIRANGGWTNWKMEIINFYNCADHYAARKKEQEYFIELNATLNSIEPFPKPKVSHTTTTAVKNPKPVFFCTTCNIHCDNMTTFDIHNKTNKHKKLLVNDISPISLKKFTCTVCSISCAKQTEWNRHINTNKHKNNENGEIVNEPGENVLGTSILFSCKCGKKYKDRSGLWRHEKKCDYKPEPLPQKKHKLYEKDDIMDVIMKENHDFKNIIIEVVKNNSELQKQNQEFQKQMLEFCKTNTTTNIQNNNNSHNKTFNLQVFLNEQCKDAMNIMDFVNSMTLELSDLEDVGNLGYVEGISKIMIRKLNELDVYKRPIHCSDAKREIMYVRDNNVWAKENSTYDKLRKAIKHVTHKNSCLLGPWSQKYPDCMNNQHRLNDVYVKMIGQAMGGKGEFVDSENKIMKKIAKAVLIDKTC